MDFCPVCGVAVEVRVEGGKAVYVCRNPQCEKFQQVIDVKEVS